MSPRINVSDSYREGLARIREIDRIHFERDRARWAKEPPGQLTTDGIIRAYLDPVAECPPFAQPIHLLASKFMPGGTSVATADLQILLTERWPCDLHFTMYTSPRAIREVKTNPPSEIKFEIAVFDADYDNHERRPTRENFADLVRSCFVNDYTPNIVYETRGGARLIYLIEPITDAALFEQHYQALLAKLAASINQGGSGYQIDWAVKDWTRLFRAPLVTRDDAEEYDRIVGVMHTDELDLLQFKVKPKKQHPKPTGDKKYTAHDAYLVTTIKEIIHGQRNTKLFAAFAWALDRYSPDAADKWITRIIGEALAAGLDDREIETTLRSARNHTGKKESTPCLTSP